MSDTSHGHEVMDECVAALHQVHAFLHGEILEADADAVRHHLHACERCMETYEIEQTIDAMIRRSHKPVHAPSTLMVRIQSIRISKRG